MRLFVTLLIIFSAGFSLAQDNVVEWKGSFDKINNAVNYKADIQKGWHLYAQAVDPMAGPIPTSFEVKTEGAAKLLGSVEEPQPIKSFDPNFESTVLYFEKSVNFTQKVEFKSPSKVICTVTYMVCNDQMCLPPVDEIITILLN